MRTLLCTAALFAALTPLFGHPLEDVGFRWVVRPPDSAEAGFRIVCSFEITNYGQRQARFVLWVRIGNAGFGGTVSMPPGDVDTTEIVTDMV